jgi:hypothetical protein
MGVHMNTLRSLGTGVFWAFLGLWCLMVLTGNTAYAVPAVGIAVATFVLSARHHTRTEIGKNATTHRG